MGAVGTAVITPLLQAPPRDFGLIREQLHYTRFPTDQWWNERAGEPVHVTDFAEWQGATAVWRGSSSTARTSQGRESPFRDTREAG